MLRARIVLSVLVAALVLPSGADAGTLTVESFYISSGRSGSSVDRITYVSAPGERNVVTLTVVGGVSGLGGEVVITDPAGVQAPPGCAAASASEAVCPLTHGGLYELDVRVDLGDGDDVVELVVPGSSWSTAELDGGDGDDRLVADVDLGALKGGPGADELVGPTSADGRWPQAIGGPGADTIRHLAASYEDQAAPVAVDLGAGTARTASGDDTLDGVSYVVGGSAADDLVGGPGADTLLGGPGDDRLIGGVGDDLLSGGAGVDALDGGDGDDELDGGDGVFGRPQLLLGGPGDDAIGGSSGPEAIDPGPGADAVEPDGGADVVQADDGEADQVACFSGDGRAVRVQADARDLVQRCGTLARSGPARVWVARTAPAREVARGERRVGLRLACSQDVPDGCTGRMRIIGPTGRRGPAAPFRLRASDWPVRRGAALPATARERLRRCGAVDVVVVIRAPDAMGNATVTRRTMTLRTVGRTAPPAC